jgi:hypothetical protein
LETHYCELHVAFANVNVHFPERSVGRGSIVYQRKAQTHEELLARIMHTATEIRDNNVNLPRVMCAVHKCVDKCIEAEGGIFENVL